jgi:hypothetical protein
MAEPGQDPLADRRIEERLICPGPSDVVEQLGAPELPQDVARGASHDGGVERLVVGV